MRRRRCPVHAPVAQNITVDLLYRQFKPVLLLFIIWYIVINLKFSSIIMSKVVFKRQQIAVFLNMKRRHVIKLSNFSFICASVVYMQYFLVVCALYQKLKYNVCYAFKTLFLGYISLNSLARLNIHDTILSVDLATFGILYIIILDIISIHKSCDNMYILSLSPNE